MSDAIFAAKAGGMAIKNDALRGAFALDGVRCFFLRHNGQTKKYERLFEPTTGHRVKFDRNRAEGGLLEYATTSISGILNIWAATTHIGYGVPLYNVLLDADAVEVYNFADGEKDKIDPDVSSVYFAGRIVRETGDASRYPVTAKATGNYTFAANPVDGDNFPDLNGFGSLVFKDSPAFWYEFDIKPTLAETIANIIQVFADNDVFREIDFASNATKLLLEFATVGIEGNDFTLGDATANITPSAPALMGGLE